MTYRERQIIDWWAVGKKIPDIAAQLCMTEEEVRKVVDANTKPDITIKIENPL